MQATKTGCLCLKVRFHRKAQLLNDDHSGKIPQGAIVVLPAPKWLSINPREGSMKKRKKTKKNDSATTARRIPALIALAVAVLVIGAISAVSRQLIAAKQSTPPENTSTTKEKKYMTVKVAGQDVQVDS